MILSDLLMSYSSKATPSAHTRWPKFRARQKWVKNAHFFIEYELFIEKKYVFFTPLPPEATNSLMTKPFELGGLQMILSEPPMSNSSESTHMDHASRPKFSFLKKMCKKLSYRYYWKQINHFLFKRISKKVEFFIIEHSKSTKLCFGSK